MGSGKSTLTAQLSFELGIPSFNSDEIRKQIMGLSPDTLVREAFGEGLYDLQTTEATYTELLCRAENQLKKRSSVVIDASFMHKTQRTPYAMLAKRLAVPFIILHVDCSEAENKRRLQDRETAGKSVSDGRLELLTLQAVGFEPPVESEGTLIPLAANTPPATLVDDIYKRLAQ
jgi:predicted kinase